MRKTVPVIVAFLSGFFMVLAFFFNPERIFIGGLEGELLSWVTIVGGFTLFLGVVSITRVNWVAVANSSLAGAKTSCIRSLPKVGRLTRSPGAVKSTCSIRSRICSS